MLRKTSIRIKFFIMVFVILIPLIAIRVFNIIASHNYEVKREIGRYEDLAKAVSTSFSNYIEEIWLMEDLVANRIINEKPQVSNQEITCYLNTIQGKMNGILRISYIDSAGNVLASSNKSLINELLSDREFYKDIISGKQKVISNLIISAISPYECILPVVRAVYIEDHLVGMIAAIINTDELDKKLPDLKIYQNNRYQLIDSNGMLVYSSDIKGTPDDMISLMNEPAVKEALEGRLVASIKNLSVLDKTHIISVDCPVPEIGWDCRVSSPYHIAMAAHYKRLWESMSILIATVVLSLLAAWVFSHYFLKPITVLTNASKKIMEGNYSVRTNLKGTDELGLAAEAFDKMAESIQQGNEIKSHFLTNMSHELKTPINVIFSSVQLIESYKTASDQGIMLAKISKQMKIIRQNCYRIMRLIGNIIDLSRHEGGFLEIKPSNYDIVKLTREITLSVQRYVEAKGIKLVFASNIESRVIACDPDMIERILLNLITNAVKFTDKNGTITVSLEETGGNITLNVKDTGSGIPKEKIGMIFERFKKADDSACLNRYGSGIGLYLVKAFVEAHGGNISVTSELSKGTAFHISLPSRMLNVPEGLPQPGHKALSTSNINDVSRINIEFSDIYSVYDEDIS